MAERKLITVHAFWDEEAGVWAAQADGGIGLFAEGETVERLREKLPVMARDLLEGEHDGPIDIVLVATCHAVAA